MENTPTDCRSVLEKLYLYLDGEIAGQQCSAIEAHFQACVDCFRRLGIERDFKALIGTRCREKRTPASVKKRIRAILDSDAV